MTNAPLITVVVPWSHALVKKTQQRLASRKNSDIRIGGSKRGWEVTATPQQFLDLGLAKESGDLSLALVSRLRQAGFRVAGSRTVHLPGGTGVVEVRIDQTPRIVSRVLASLEARDGADVVTVYDRAGVGHTRVLGAIKAVVQQVPKVHSVKVARRKRWATRESALVDAIRRIWEDKAEEFTRNVKWDSEDYEAYTVQELVSGLLPDFLTSDQLKQWNNMEAEAQTEVLNAAFPEDKIQDTVNRVDRSFWGRERGASRRVFAEQPPEKLQQSPAGTPTKVSWLTVDLDKVDWSKISDPWEQMQRARKILIDRPPLPPSPPITSAREKKPQFISTDPTIKELHIFEKRLLKAQEHLAKLQKARKPDPKAIKKAESMVKKAEQSLAEQSTPRPEDWHTVEGLTKAAKTFLERMGGDETYVDWYDRHIQDVKKLFDEDIPWGGGPDKFYLIMAALSPRSKVQINASKALGAYASWKAAAEVKDKSFRFTKEAVPGGAMKGHLKNLNRVLDEEKLSGPKVYPFSQNLTGNLEEVTIDMWMGVLLFATKMPNNNQVAYGKEVVREIAGLMGKSPRYVQGLLWEMTMDYWGQPPADFMVSINRALDSHEKWQTFNVTPPAWWNKQEQEKKKLIQQQQRLEKQQLLQQQKLEKQQQRQLERDQKKLQPKSAPIAPTSSRRVAFSLNDDPKEVALAVMEVLGLQPANPGDVQRNPVDMGANEAPVLSRAARIFD